LQSWLVGLGVERYGAAAGAISAGKFHAVKQLCEIARVSPSPVRYVRRLGPKGNAAAHVKLVWKDVVALLDEFNRDPRSP